MCHGGAIVPGLTKTWRRTLQMPLLAPEAMALREKKLLRNLYIVPIIVE